MARKTFYQWKGAAMIKKRILDPRRVRRIDGGFSFIPHRFLTGGFVSALLPGELLLYFFLVLAGDKNGLSYYSYDTICSLLRMPLEAYLQARDALIGYDLLAFDGTIFQVLELPPSAPAPKPQRSSLDGLVGNMFKEMPA
jgi:hypothetical protein